MFREALEQADKQARGKVVLLPAYIALAKCWEWINVKAATTGSATWMGGLTAKIYNLYNSCILSMSQLFLSESSLWLRVKCFVDSCRCHNRLQIFTRLKP
jgi:hypothetical protein